MEPRANYLLVGAFVLVMATLLLAFALWLGRAQFESNAKRYDIYFVGSVAGLKNGSAVSYRGINVGQVVNIEIDPQNFERVLVTIEVAATTPVREDTKARLEVQGIAGVPFVNLEGGTISSPPLEPKPGERYPVIASERSRLEQLLSGAPELVDRIESLLASANDLLGPENRKAFANMMKNFESVSAAVASQSPEISQAVDDFSATMSNLREASASVQRLVDNLQTETSGLSQKAGTALDSFNTAAASVDRELPPMMTDLRDASKSIATLADQMAAIVEENKVPINNFASTGLADFNAFVLEARQLVENLNRISTEFERDPARFLFGNQQQGYDAPAQ